MCLGVDLDLMNANLLLWMCRVLALEVVGVLGVTVSVILRVFWIRAERTAAARECLPGGGNGIRGPPLLDPVDDGGEHVEVIESGPTATMGHARDKEHPAPLGNLVCTPVGCSKGFVIVKRVKRREPRIAVAVEEDELATAERERGEIRGRGFD